MNSSGFIVIHRQLLDWKYFMFSNAVTLWIYILLRANWRDGFFLGEEIPRGSFATSIAKMSADTGISEASIKRWLKRFEEDGQIERKTTNRCTIIKVSNYAAFQDIQSEGVTQPMTQQMTQPVNHQTTQQMTEQMTHQMSYQVNHNITNKQINKNNKETNIKTRAEKSDLSEKDIFESIASWNNIPSLDMIAETVSEEKLGINPEKFYDYYTERDWKVDEKPIRDWKKLLRSWSRKEIREPSAGVKIPLPEHFYKKEPETADEDDDEVIRQIKEMQSRML